MGRAQTLEGFLSQGDRARTPEIEDGETGRVRVN